MELVANFLLNNDSLDAEFDVSEVQNFDALFEIYAGGVTWGNISGDLENQTDLQNELNTLSGAIDSNHQAITEINTTMQGYGDIVTHDVSEFATSAQGAKADSALQPNDNITELNNNAGYITSAAIGDGTLTIQVNNETVGTFTANQSGNTTANIEVPDSATWGNITGDIEDQTDLTTVLDSKQDVLTPGTDIEITQNNTINFTNSSGYITGISGTDVTNALGYTPYDEANPDKFIKNTATGTNAITVNGTATSSSQAINIGKGSSATKSNAVALGYNASAAGSSSVAIGNSAGASTAGISGVAIGDGAKSQAQYAIQLGKGTNPVASTLSVGFGSNNYTLLNGSTGLIPNGRLSTGIARTSDMNAADDELQAQIDNLKARGRFLALWNCATGLAETNPTSSPYTYQTGDYFIIGVVSTATPPVNYKPDGSSYTTGVASTTVETAAVDVDDVYYYDGSTWHLQINTQKTTAFVNIAGSPYDNIELAQALNSKADNSDITNLETAINAKQDALTPGTDIEIVTGGSLVPLPTGYTQIEYITTDGTAYIDTGITVAETDTLDFSFTDTSSATTVMFITGRNGSDGQTMYFVSPSSSLIQWKGRPAGVTLAKGLEYNMVLKSGEVTYTNVYGTTTKTFTGGAISDTGTCLIGAGRSGATTIDSRKFIGNISKWQIKDSSNNLRFNGVPCYNSNNVYGLYDVVSDTFFPSIGTSDFTGGAEVVAGTVINFTNASGYITGIDSTDVTTALGYTPYNSSNPDGYTDNVGTVTSVNNVQPDSSGNVTIPTGGTVDQTYDGTSANAQSGVAIAGAGFLNNTATGTSALTINGTATAKTQAINIGTLSQATANYGTTVGAYSYANGSKSSAFGNYARATADRAIQLGQGTNSTADTLQIGFNGTTYQLLDGTTGLIPDARISNNIARTSAIPTSSTVAGWGFITGINSSDVITALGYTPYDATNPDNYLKNTATGTNALTILGTASTVASGINIGGSSRAGAGFSVALGHGAQGNGATSTALGYGAIASVNSSIQIGKGTNSTANSLSVGFNGASTNYQLLDGTTGLIPDARISSNIARTSDIMSRNIGEIVTSTIPLTDAGLHLLDGSLIQSGSYSAFVDYIAGLTSDYPDLFDTEANWQQSVNDYGVCGKFVYDSINNTVRLPKITGVVEGTTDLTALGDLIEAGLPNITGEFIPNNASGSAYPGSGSTATGAFSTSSAGSGNVLSASSGSAARVYFGFSARQSNSIYGNSATVQPQAIKVLYYIVIATTTKTNIQVDIDEIATDLNGKADTDLSNLTSTACTNFDGQWVQSQITLGTSTAKATYNIDVSSYLPNDNYNYEVMINLRAYSSNSSNAGTVYVYSDIWQKMSDTTSPSGQGAAGGYSRQIGNTFILPVGTGRKVYYEVVDYAMSSLQLISLGYRRIGTNS